jgi:type VI secretion system protein ImpM
MEVGLYGKLPTHGDFLRRRVAEDFVAGWDAWLQHSIADSRTALGERWLDTYLTSPVWRFALGAGACGSAAVAGVLVPSVDRVGRYFPLTLVWATPSEFSALEVAMRYQRLFERAERLVVDSLALEQLEFVDFDRKVIELAADPMAAPTGAMRLENASTSSVLSGQRGGWRVPLRTVSALEAPIIQLLGCHLQASYGAVSVWWTDGSAAVEPSWLITRGLPDPKGYSAMLDGAWPEAGWEVALAEPDSAMPETGPTVHSAEALISSSARSDQGPVRASNQDAFLERPDMGLWAVADGLGGLSQGEVASRMVCDALADSTAAGTLDEQIEVAMEQLRRVNEYLHRTATRAVNPVQSASTVVALLIRRKECAILWAGDSRAYRLRDGLLSQMTTDHSWAGPGDGEDAASGSENDAQAVTRAVGGEELLQLDIVRSDVRPGDRFLLCSDGIARVLDVSALARALQSAAPEPCCAQLIAQSIAQGATDNVTAVVIDCAEPADLHPTVATDEV